ncbi:MAG TPA: type II secretion system F family protein [Solirubrobacteraceae bacterium]|nr:type II secretion system F family protein [Solirubrobacteraceae bacterium]
MSATLAAGLWVAVLAVVLAVRSVTAPRRVRAALAHVERYGLASRPAPAAADGSGEAVDRSPSAVAAALGRSLAARVSSSYVERLRHDLVAAGHYDTPPETVLGAQALLGSGAALIAIVLVASAHAGLGLGLALVAVATGAALVLPSAILSRRARMRLAVVDREMPELVDLLVVAVEAGLGLFAALGQASARMSGPLHDEIRLVLREQRLGVGAAEALTRFAERCDTPGVQAFVRALVYGEHLGISVGQSLRALAVDMRKRRQAWAEERAQKMPIKVLFPLVFCIFPALFVVLLVPAVMRILQGLHG